MRHLRPLLLSTVLGAGVLAMQVAPVFAQAAGCPPVQSDFGAPLTTGGADVAVYADEAPPPLPDYDQPPIPAEGDMWTPGYWSWNGYEYFWVPGTWVEPPQPGFLWTPGYWAFVGGVYAFHRGYWGEHVGFYGGVNYGFGYGGAGYEGGHWDNGRFFYNRSVTNIGRVNITNVYNQPVTIVETDEPGELQRRPERRRRQTDRRRTRSGEGEACRADRRPAPQRARRRPDRIRVRLRQQGQTAASRRRRSPASSRARRSFPPRPPAARCSRSARRRSDAGSRRAR